MIIQLINVHYHHGKLFFKLLNLLFLFSVNNGTCINLGVTYLCTCPTGYTGRSCEQIINPMHK